MSSQRPRRALVPSEKQKQILAERAIAIAPKQPKVSRNAPAEVQKRREAASGSIVSQPIELVKRTIRPSGSGIKLVKYSARQSDTTTVSRPTSQSITSVERSSKRQVDSPQLGKENRPANPTSTLGSPIRLQRRAGQTPAAAELFASNEDVEDGRIRRAHPHAPSPPPPSSSPAPDIASDSSLSPVVYFNEDDEQYYDGNGALIDYDMLELAEQEDDPEADLELEVRPETQSTDTSADSGIDQPHVQEAVSNVTTAPIRKRPRASSDVADSEEAHLKVKKVNKRDGRLRCKDFESHEQDYIKYASNAYRAYLASDCLFPDAATEGRFVKGSWSAACKEMGEELEISPQVHKMLTRIGSHFRSVCKLEVRPVVMNVYGFKTSRSNKTKIFNSTHAAKLKSNQCFARPLSQLDIPSEKRTGIYHSKAIGQFLINALFKRKDSIGIMHADYFGTSMPKPTIAFALTMLEFGISEWSSGAFVDTKFHETDWKKTYFDHLADLAAFEKAMQRFNALNKIAVKLLDDARAHAGVGPLQSGEKHGRVSERSLMTELAAYEAGAVFVSDDEDGHQVEIAAATASTTSTSAAAM